MFLECPLWVKQASAVTVLSTYFVIFIVQVQLLFILREPDEIFDDSVDLEPIASVQIL